MEETKTYLAQRKAEAGEEETKTCLAQRKVEADVLSFFSQIGLNWQLPVYQEYVEVYSKEHSNFCYSALCRLPRSVSTLNSGQPWLLFWILNALDLMRCPITEEIKTKTVAYIAACKCPHTGAFCGGPGQIPHLAPTYAATMALAIVGTQAAYDLIDRQGIRDFLISMKHPDQIGAFRMHKDGESDMRAIYCAMSVAKMINVLDEQVMAGVPEFIGGCQTYEGGIAAEPGGEAHGGFTYCGAASLSFMGRKDTIDWDHLHEWISMRQMSVEGGFQGRTNKLVDSCYSFWQGAAFYVLNDFMGFPVTFNANGLQAYILVCCQSISGLIDRPGSSPDYYHTSYALAGLSLAFEQGRLFIEDETRLKLVDFNYNIPRDRSAAIQAYFLTR